MDYFRPGSLDEAVRLLADDPDARCLAGGQTLVAMMNTGIVAPPRIVSLRDIPGLKDIEYLPDGTVRLGAMVTHAALERLSVTGSHRLLPQAAGQIASPAIRAFGTIGGSICHADPAADWPVVLIALGAAVEVTGPAGARTEPVDTFITDALTTSLTDGEILTHILIPAADPGSGGGYVKLTRVEGDFATVSVAAVVTVSDGICERARLAVGGCGPVPVRSSAAEELLQGTGLATADAKAAGELLAEAMEPEDDGRASASYRRLVTPGLVARAVREAAGSR